MNNHVSYKTRHSGSLFLSQQQTKTSLTSVLISKQAIECNIESYKSVVGPNVALAPVIKSNAYGHGILEMASVCQNNPHVEMLCVAALSEAIMLRKEGITKPILVLNIIDSSLEDVVDKNIDIALYDVDIAEQLNAIARAQQKIARVHIKVDTGLSRLGILWNNVAAYAQQCAELTNVTVGGIFTHFAESEKTDQTFTNLQLERFDAAVATFESFGITIPLRHTSCSAAITSNVLSHHTMARVGIGIYGLWPSLNNKITTQTKFPQFSLIPALTWQTTVIQVKTVPAGSFVGYDRTFQTQRETRIATLPVGYWDGIDRDRSNKGYVLVHNRRAPIIGRIAMNTMMIDVTDCPPTHVGDVVILLGNYEGITADDLAHESNTINYEVVTRINPLLPRYIT